MQKWQLEKGYFLYQLDENNCGPIACMKIMELFHFIDAEEAREVYRKKSDVLKWLSGIGWCFVAARIFQ
jgi:hypothetical protein